MTDGAGQTIDERIKLRVERVSKRYGSVAALLDATLEVREGECVTLLGPSGSGKTTLLNIVSGLLIPDEGSVWIGGRDATYLRPEARDIGMVFQNYALFPHLSVFENIAFPLRMRRRGRAEVARRVGQALSVVGLLGMEHRLPAELSGGQQQRTALARCLVYEPSIILMDEPLAALDRKLREQLQLEIRRVQRELRVTMLYVTHDQQEALLLSDRICLMNDARIEQVGTPADLYFRPSTPFAAEFIGESNVFEATAGGTAGELVLTGPGDRRLAMSAPVAAPNGAPVRLMVRPESISLSAGDPADGTVNQLAGRIVEVTFLGEATKYYVRVGDEHLFVIKMLTRAESGEFGPGTLVTLSFGADSLIALGCEMPAGPARS